HIGIGRFAQSRELVQQSPFAVAFKGVTLRVSRERLARGTSSENFHICIAKECGQFDLSYRTDIALDESSLIVCLIRKTTCRVHIDAGHYRQPFLHEAVRQTSRTTEQIDTRNFQDTPLAYL